MTDFGTTRDYSSNGFNMSRDNLSQCIDFIKFKYLFSKMWQFWPVLSTVENG